ncbi:MAG: hypothetical protein ACETWK_00225 [Candidatus Aminicenantaceae bacterium]
MKKEEFVKFFNELSFEDKIEVIKSIMPEFCKSLNREPNRMQEMMRFMMGFWEQGMGDWMGMMGK